METPSSLAIIGAGPIGLESAIYARYLGYQVQVFERGHVAENVMRWGHVRLFTPFGMNRSSLGVAALAAQEPQWTAPPDDAILTGREFAEQYLIPLSQSDLLCDSIRAQTEVLSIGRAELLKADQIGDPSRARGGFLIQFRDANGAEQFTTAEAVIDTTGTYGNPNWLGPGGIPALGERSLGDAIEYGLPDIKGADREHYAGRHTLVVGAGYSSATSIVELSKLAADHPETRLTWITRERTNNRFGGGPIARIESDRLPERDKLAEAANALAASGSVVTHLSGGFIESIQRNSETDPFEVTLTGETHPPLMVDRIIANVGYRPNGKLHEELQIHTCYATDGPMALAASLLGETSPGSSSSVDCLDQVSHGAAALIHPEPNYYILGSKSYGRSSRFLISVGLDQIREIFTRIGDRDDLDLYATISEPAGL